MGKLNIMGIDASLSSTGYSYRDEGEPVVGLLLSKFKGMPRLEHQLNQLRNVLDYAQPDLIVYEDYALGVKGQGRWSSAELGGQFKLEIYRRGIDLILVPPTTLKLAFAGKGNADKPKMKAAGVSLFDLDEDLNDDEVDAYALRSLGEAMLYGEGPSEFVKRAKAAIGKVELHHGKGRPKVQTIAQLSVG